MEETQNATLAIPKKILRKAQMNPTEPLLQIAEKLS